MIAPFIGARRLEEEQGRLVGPVEIFEHDEERLLCRRVAEKPRDTIEEAESSGFGVVAGARFAA